MTRWIAALPLVVLALLAALFAGYALHHDPHVNPSALVGKPLPDLTLPALDGAAARHLRADAGPATLVNFYASWCAPCAVEHPALMALKSEGVRIVGVAYKEDEGRTRAYLDRLGDPFAAVLVDRDGLAAIDLGVSGAPETFAVNAAGEVVAKHSGILTPADADKLIRAASGTR